MLVQGSGLSASQRRRCRVGVPLKDGVEAMRVVVRVVTRRHAVARALAERGEAALGLALAPRQVGLTGRGFTRPTGGASPLQPCASCVCKRVCGRHRTRPRWKVCVCVCVSFFGHCSVVLVGLRVLDASRCLFCVSGSWRCARRSGDGLPEKWRTDRPLWVAQMRRGELGPHSSVLGSGSRWWWCWWWW